MPRLSKLFKLGVGQAELDFVDITTDRDTRLFLEPFAISLKEDVWSEHCQDHLVSFFDAVIQAIREKMTFELGAYSITCRSQMRPGLDTRLGAAEVEGSEDRKPRSFSLH